MCATYKKFPASNEEMTNHSVLKWTILQTFQGTESRWEARDGMSPPETTLGVKSFTQNRRQDSGPPPPRSSFFLSIKNPLHQGN